MDKNLGWNVEVGRLEERKRVAIARGLQGASSRHSRLEQTNGRQTDRAVSNRREAHCALDVSLHLSFSKCCLVCSPLNKAAVPPNQNALYLLLYIITRHSSPGLFATLTNVVCLCTNEGQAAFGCRIPADCLRRAASLRVDLKFDCKAFQSQCLDGRALSALFNPKL